MQRHKGANERKGNVIMCVACKVRPFVACKVACAAVYVAVYVCAAVYVTVYVCAAVYVRSAAKLQVQAQQYDLANTQVQM